MRLLHRQDAQEAHRQVRALLTARDAYPATNRRLLSLRRRRTAEAPTACHRAGYGSGLARRQCPAQRRCARAGARGDAECGSGLRALVWRMHHGG